MSEISSAIKRLKTLECPTGELESRVMNILEEYGITDSSLTSVNRDDRYDSEWAQGYSVKISDNIDKTIVVLARAGSDDYVAKVVDAYIH